MDEDLGRARAIVYDFDGVLVDSNDLKRDTFYEIWDRPPASLRALVDQVLARPGDRFSFIREVHDQLGGRPSLGRDAQHYIERYTRAVEDAILARGLKPDVPPFLEAHVDQIQLINSATPEAPLRSIVSRLGLGRWIRETRGRPLDKTGIFAYFMAKYQLTPDEILFVGDAESDYQVARQLGLAFLGIASAGGSLRSVPGRVRLPAPTA